MSDPIDFLRRYLFRGGAYPHQVHVKAPSNPRMPITVYSGEDILTINEIFCRIDYPLQGNERVVVDFGSNIGISALWWLTYAPHSFVHLYEPLAMNLERLRVQLQGHQGRFDLNPVAVGLADGEVEFGHEPSGRYGGIGRKIGSNIKVPCVDSNVALERVLERHGHIDVLKVDIETMEKAVTERIPREIVSRIRTLYIELPFAENPHADTHDMEPHDAVTWFHRKPGIG